MPIEPYVWMKLAGNFPPGLVTNVPDSLLKEDFTPDAANMNINADGYMQSGTIPSGTARTVQQYTIGANVYDYHYERLWRFSGSQVIFNAPIYTAVYLPQGTGTLDLNESSGSILAMLPIGETGLIFLRSGGSNIITQANDKRAYFFTQDYAQEVSISTATHAVELDGLVYYVNTSGLFSVDIQGNVKELSQAVYGSITPAALTADYLRKQIIIGTALVYDVQKEKFFKYATGSFYYYSRQLRSSDNSTITVNKIGFEYDKSSTTAGEIQFKTQTETRGWSKTFKCSVLDREEMKEHAEIDIDPAIGLTWQLYITQLPSNIKLKNIWVRVKGFTPESRES